MANIKLLHVLALGYQPQGVFSNKGMQAQHANLGIALPLLELLKYKNSKMPKVDKQKITMF